MRTQNNWKTTTTATTIATMTALVRKQRRVQFRPVEAADIIPSELDGMEEAEFQRCWITSAEEGVMERERRATFRALRRSRGDPSSFDSKKYSTRGLEERLNPEYATALERQHEAIMDAVMAEQESQTARGIVDPEMLRAASLIHSKWSLDLSCALGSTDATAVEPENCHMERDQWHLVESMARQRNTLADTGTHSKVEMEKPSTSGRWTSSLSPPVTPPGRQSSM